jgi:hypothetical protein
MPSPRSRSSRHDRRRYRDEETGGSDTKSTAPPTILARLLGFVHVLVVIVVALAVIFAAFAGLLFHCDSTLFYDWTASVLDPNIPRPGEPFHWSWLFSSEVEEIEYTDLLHPSIMKAMREGTVRIKPQSDIDALVNEDSDAQTAAYYAALNGLLEPFQFYFKRGMNRNFAYAGRPMLHAAIESGNLELVAWMLKQGKAFDPEGADEDGHTALLHLVLMTPDDEAAIEQRNEWLATRERILKEGLQEESKVPDDAEVNRSYYLYGQPPIAMSSDELIRYKQQVLKLLKLRNTDFDHLMSSDSEDSCKETRYSALSWALKRGDVQLVNYLLELGANPLIQHPYKDSMTAFDYAMEMDDANLVKAFLSHGADSWRYSREPDELGEGAEEKGVETVKGKEHRLVIAVRSQWPEAVRAFLEFDESKKQRYLPSKVVKAAIGALNELPSDSHFQPQIKALFVKHSHMSE